VCDESPWSRETINSCDRRTCMRRTDETARRKMYLASAAIEKVRSFSSSSAQPRQLHHGRCRYLIPTYSLRAVHIVPAGNNLFVSNTKVTHADIRTTYSLTRSVIIRLTTWKLEPSRPVPLIRRLTLRQMVARYAGHVKRTLRAIMYIRMKTN